jgi:CheY-like chemotaxis protein
LIIGLFFVLIALIGLAYSAIAPNLHPSIPSTPTPTSPLQTPTAPPTPDTTSLDELKKKARLKQRILQQSKVLWVDDHPSNNESERKTFKETFGITSDIATSTAEALSLLRNPIDPHQGVYNLIITTFSRRDDSQAGYTLLKEVEEHFKWIPVILYARSASQIEEQAKALGAFGATSDPDKLLDLAIDAINTR